MKNVPEPQDRNTRSRAARRWRTLLALGPSIVVITLGIATLGGIRGVRRSRTGLGIPSEKIATIFDPFVQVESSHSRTAEGTGLGLAISRELARGMGGDLVVESTVGRGSTFTLTLPRAKPAPVDISPPVGALADSGERDSTFTSS